MRESLCSHLSCSVPYIQFRIRIFPHRVHSDRSLKERRLNCGHLSLIERCRLCESQQERRLSNTSFS